MKYIKKFESSNKFNINSYVARKRKSGIIYIILDVDIIRSIIWIYKIKNIDTNMHEWVTEKSLRNLTEDEKIILSTKKYNL